MAKNADKFDHTSYIAQVAADYGRDEAKRMRGRLTGYPFCLPGTSPIETMFGCAMVKILERRIDVWSGVEEAAFSQSINEKYEDLSLPPIQGIFCFYQVYVGPYRADFIIAIRTLDHGTSFCAVEVDGHEFHERTKVQAERDKKRDRYFHSRAIPVFRFSGSEVWRDPDECVESLLNDCEAAHVLRNSGNNDA